MVRTCAAFLLTLLLALTGQTMAVARGATDAHGQMIICTGHGPVAVWVDGDGQPTDAPHVCPDCIAQALTGILADNPDATQQACLTARRSFPDRLQRVIAVDVECPARGPPRLLFS